MNRSLAGDTKSKRLKPSGLTQPTDKVSTSKDASDCVPVPEAKTGIETSMQDQNKDTSGEKSLTPAGQVPLRMKTLNDPGDIIRLARAKKLRDLLKKELNKDKVCSGWGSCLCRLLGSAGGNFVALIRADSYFKLMSRCRASVPIRRSRAQLTL